MDTLIFIAIILITLLSNLYVKAMYSKYDKIPVKKGINGYDMAKYITNNNGINNIYIVSCKGTLTDHYDPARKTIRLSESVYNQSSISSIAIAAHESGHAIQDHESYAFLKIRNAIAPTISFINNIGYITILIGLFSGLYKLFLFGIICSLTLILFQLITLPIEFNASKKALINIENSSNFTKAEINGAKKVLTAAAFTYVAGAFTSLLNLIRLYLISRDN